jgi:hypothetical protein
MGVSGQCHALAALYPRGNDAQYPLYRRLGGPQSRSGCGLEEKSLASAGDRTSIAWSSRLKSDTMLTELPQLQYLRCYILKNNITKMIRHGIVVNRRSQG